MKTLIISHSEYQDHEMIYPFFRCQEEGEVHVMSDIENGRVYGILGAFVNSNVSYKILFQKDFYNHYMDHYDFLVLPGGLKAIEKLRQEEQVVRFITEWCNKNKIIAVTCNGIYMLISARVTKGRTLTGYYSSQIDVENSQATYINKPVVVDKNIISSQHYKDLSPWMTEAIKVWKERNELD